MNANDNELIRHIHADLADSCDEELELELDDRLLDPATSADDGEDAKAQRRQQGGIHQAKEIMLERTHIPEAPWWVVQAVDEKRARLNCIHHLLGQVPYAETEHAAIVLPGRERHEDYIRYPVPREMIVREVH